MRFIWEEEGKGEWHRVIGERRGAAERCRSCRYTALPGTWAAASHQSLKRFLRTDA